MREYKIGLIRTKLEFADVTVKASSPEEAKARAVDWLNFGGLSDAEEFVTDHNDDPYGGRGFDDALWEAQDDVQDLGEVMHMCGACGEPFEESKCTITQDSDTHTSATCHKCEREVEDV